MGRQNKRPHRIRGRDEKDFEKYQEEALQAMRQLGRLHEEYIEQILLIAIKKGFLKNVIRHEALSDEDRKGYDITIFDLQGKEYHLQVKSSCVGAQDFQRNGDGSIPVIVATLRSRPSTIVRELRKIFPCLSGFKLENKELSELHAVHGKLRNSATSFG